MPRSALSLSFYFKPGAYVPTCTGPQSCSCRDGFDTENFAILVHELVHVMQYRSKGFKDFTCLYSLECGLGAVVDLECSFEQQAFIYHALEREDMRRDGDGIFTCPLGECDDEAHEWNLGNIADHSCSAEVALCGVTLGTPDAPDYCAANDNCPDVANPDQVDTEHGRRRPRRRLRHLRHLRPGLPAVRGPRRRLRARHRGQLRVPTRGRGPADGLRRQQRPVCPGAARRLLPRPLLNQLRQRRPGRSRHGRFQGRLRSRRRR